MTTESPFSKEDIKLVLDVFLRKKKKNTVIVGDSVSLTEGLVGELMGRLERGEVPDELKSTHFIKFQFAPVSLSGKKKWNGIVQSKCHFSSKKMEGDEGLNTGMLQREVTSRETSFKGS
ncbi:hypothetical protein SESBI_47837 [Sesbania bispinosa]|nr:hypothetical protein SESBI_47837 [Sesbania bispinosa]